LDAYFQGVGKRDFWATGNVAIPGYGGNGQFLGNQMDCWTPDNPNAQWPVPYYGNSTNNLTGETVWAKSLGTSGNNFYPQTKYLFNMAYLRLKTLTVGYSLPDRLIKKIGIDKLRIYAQGMNLFTFDSNQLPIDPEITTGSAGTGGTWLGLTYPFNKTYSFGLQLTF